MFLRGLGLGFFERRQPTKRTAAGAGPDTHAVLSGGLQRHKSLGDEPGQRLDLQLFDQGAVLHAEIGEHVIIDRHLATQPFVGAMLEAKAFHARGALLDALGGRIEPKSEEDLGIAGVASGDAFDGVDLLIEARQVETLHELPN